MSKRNYTHVQEFLPEIKAMVECGKSQREIAEYFGFKDKNVVKELLKRGGGRKEGLLTAFFQGQRGDRGKMLRQEISWQSRHMKSSV